MLKKAIAEKAVKIAETEIQVIKLMQQMQTLKEEINKELKEEQKEYAEKIVTSINNCNCCTKEEKEDNTTAEMFASDEEISDNELFFDAVIEIYSTINHIVNSENSNFFEITNIFCAETKDVYLYCNDELKLCMDTGHIRQEKENLYKYLEYLKKFCEINPCTDIKGYIEFKDDLFF